MVREVPGRVCEIYTDVQDVFRGFAGQVRRVSRREESLFVDQRGEKHSENVAEKIKTWSNLPKRTGSATFGPRTGWGGEKQVLIAELIRVDADGEQNPLVISKLNCNYCNDTYDCGSYASTCYC